MLIQRSTLTGLTDSELIQFGNAAKAEGNHPFYQECRRIIRDRIQIADVLPQIDGVLQVVS